MSTNASRMTFPFNLVYNILRVRENRVTSVRVKLLTHKNHFKAKMSLTCGRQPLSMGKPSGNGYCTLVTDWTETRAKNFSLIVSLFTTLLFKTIKGEKNVIAAHLLRTRNEAKEYHLHCK